MGINNMYGIPIVQIFTMSAANLFLTMGYMRTISREIDDAAKIDGCSFFRTYYNIIFTAMQTDTGYYRADEL